MLDNVLQLACFVYAIMGFYLSYAVGKNDVHKTVLEIYLLITGLLVMAFYIFYFNVIPSASLHQ